jgi:phage protein D/phage baseplate assembly protein gpV
MPEEIKITINGRQQSDLLHNLLEVIVDTSLHMPSMFSLLIQDDEIPETGNMKYTDSETFKVGAAVKIEMKTDELPDGTGVVSGILISGEITALEPVFSAGGPVMLRVRGYDKSHRLTRGKKTRTFLKMTDSDIFKKITGGIGLSVSVDSTSTQYDYVMQYNQTDWDFLWSRAQRIGYQVYSSDGKLFFKKAGTEINGIKPSKLSWGFNMRKFEPRISVAGLINETVSMGWDYQEKKLIEGKETGPVKVVPQIGFGKNNGGDLAKTAFSSTATDYSTDISLFDAGNAKDIATGLKIRTESTFIQAEGECAYGDPRLIAGKTVEVDGVGKKFSGKYYVTSAQHHFSNGEYTVYFGVSGQDPNTLHSLLKNDGSFEDNRIYGVVTAVVTDLKDELNIGRVKVKFPWMPKDSGAEMSSTWARLVVPSGGKSRGIYFAPEIDDEVLVVFEQGDINSPYIVGALWNKKDTPPEGTAKAVENGEVNQRVIRSKSGHIIVLDDKSGEEKITIQDKTSKNSIVIDSSEKSMTIKSEGDLIFEAGGKFTVTSKGDVSFDSKAKMSIKSQSQFSVEATQKASIKAGPGEFVLQPSGAALKGPMVEVKGSGMVQVQGGMVKIN